jgi:hypothetical protein
MKVRVSRDHTFHILNLQSVHRFKMHVSAFKDINSLLLQFVYTFLDSGVYRV